MFKKMMRKAVYVLSGHAPKPMRDAFFRSRLNFKPLPPDLIFEIARTQSDLDAAFHLLHDAYVREGFSKPHISGRRITDYHSLPSTTTLLAKCHGEVVATITVIRDGPFGLPSDAVVDLSSFRHAGERLGEVSSLAISPQFRGRSGEVMFHLFKYMLHYSMYYFGLERFIIVVNPNRISLYESILTFEKLPTGAVRTYDFANGAPGVCATLDLVHLEDTFRRVYGGRPVGRNVHHFFFGPYGPSEFLQFRFPDRPYHAVFDPVMSPDLMNYFFNQCTDFFCHIEPRKIKILKNIYREKVYDRVWPQCELPEWQPRHHSRFDVACSAALPGDESFPTNLHVLDASREGIRLRSNLPRRQQWPSALNVSVGKEKTAQIQVSCRWRKEAVAGLKIVGCDDEWHRFIDYLEKRMTQVSATSADHKGTGETIHFSAV
jgi:hypothetical protein